MSGGPVTAAVLNGELPVHGTSHRIPCISVL